MLVHYRIVSVTVTACADAPPFGVAVKVMEEVPFGAVFTFELELFAPQLETNMQPKTIKSRPDNRSA